MNTGLLLLLVAGLVFGDNAPRASGTMPSGMSKHHAKIRQRVLQYLPLFVAACARYKLPLQMVLAIAHGEGSGNPKALSRAGALGLMQLMPDTARKMGLTVNSSIDERLDPEKNINGGCKLLRILLNKEKDWDRVLAAYNSGNPNPSKRQKYINYIRSFIPLYSGF